MTLRVAIVSTADLAREVGAPLSASYWTGKREGETFGAWKKRTRAAEEIDAATRHLEHAAAALRRAQSLLGEES